LPRDDDEGVGAILVFDRSSLKTRYKLECIDNGWATDASEFNEFWRAMHDEFEEHVFARDVEIALHLIAMISTPIASLSHKQRAVNRAMELRFDHKTADCDPAPGEIRFRMVLSPVHNHDLWTIRGEYGSSLCSLRSGAPRRSASSTSWAKP
jgi:hypothetical protein